MPVLIVDANSAVSEMILLVNRGKNPCAACKCKLNLITHVKDMLTFIFRHCVMESYGLNNDIQPVNV